MNWYIGQKVVAVKDHTQGAFKKGQQFEILGIMKAPCSCGSCLLDIGHKVRKGMFSGCGIHGVIIEGSTAWRGAVYFAPIEPKQELSEHTTETLIEELEEQLQPC